MTERVDPRILETFPLRGLPRKSSSFTPSRKAMGGQGYFLRILGPPGLEDRDGSAVELPVGKPLALLIHLHLSDKAVGREELGILLWSDSTRDRARGSVRHALWLLRKNLGDELFQGEDPVALSTGILDSDVAQLRAALAGGRLEEAVELWGGPPLAQFPDLEAPAWSRWVEGVRLDLEGRLGEALARRARGEQAGGRAVEAAECLRQAIRVQPHRLNHRLELAGLLADLRDFREADQILLEARKHFDTPEDRRQIEEVKARLRKVRRGPLAPENRENPVQFEFVGRSDEFAALLGGWRRSRTGESGLGLVTGEPGIGKTRLCEEVGVVASTEGARVVHVKAEDSERPIEWGLLAEVVQRLLKLSGAAGISRASDAVLRTLVPSLALADPGPEDPSHRGSLLRASRTRPSAALSDAVSDLITAVSEDAPLFLVLDDLQWADTESRAVLARVATHLPEAAVFLLFTCRSEVDDPRIRKTLNLLSEAEGAVAIQLQPWSLDELSQLLARRVEFPTPEEANRVIARVHRASRGNPLFVMELLKVLSEEGHLEERPDGTWKLLPHRLPPDLPLPESVRGLVDRQLVQLSDDATMVAAHLARIGHPASPRILSLRSGLGTSSVTHGVGELLQRRMVRWEDGENLAFSHDEIRATVARRFQLHVGLTTGGGAQWSFFRTAVAASLAILSLGAVAYALQRPESGVGPFGGGQIILETGEEAAVFRLRDGMAEELTFAASRDSGRDPDFLAASPGGGWELWRESPPEGDFELRLRRNGTEKERTLHRSPAPIHAAEVSPRGRLVALVLSGRPDSILILTAGGELLESFTAPEVVAAAWCGDSELALVLRKEGEVGLHLWDAMEAELAPLELPGLVLGGALACSPDGRALLIQAATEGDPGLHLHLRDIGTRALLVPEEWMPTRIRWIAEGELAHPTDLRIIGPTQRHLAWGETLLLEMELDGSGSRGGVPARNEASWWGDGLLRWRSSDPEVAWVSPEGRVRAMGEGSTWIHADWDGWIGDSVRVVVEGSHHPAVLLRGGFSTSGLDGWISTDASGSGRGWEVTDQVLTLGPTPKRPDRWAELRSVERVALPRGGTLELRFRLPVTQEEGQFLEACLEPEGKEGKEVKHEACFRYPAGSGARWDPQEVKLRTHPRFPATVAGAPTLIPTEEWVHLGLQVDPDGETSIFLNREFVGVSPVRIPLESERPWLVRLRGGAVGSRLEIQDLILWDGPRF